MTQLPAQALSVYESQTTQFISASSSSLSVTTMSANDIIIVEVAAENASAHYDTVLSVTASGMTFTKRSQVQSTNNGGAVASGS